MKNRLVAISIVFIILAGLISGIFMIRNRMSEDNPQGQSSVILGYLRDIDGNEISIDEVEWITDEMTDRIDELGIQPEQDMMGGFYIFNESEELSLFLVDESCVIETYVYDPSYRVITQKYQEFARENSEHGFGESMMSGGLFWVETNAAGTVVGMKEQYVP